MNPVLIAVIVLGAVALVCGLLLVMASHFMAVPVDEKFLALREVLPGANCGGCGYPGCDGYAKALADGREEKTNKCSAGGNEVAEKLAAACGKSFEEAEKRVAFVQCRGEIGLTEKKDEYQGTKSCQAARLLFGGDGACQYGCLGYGDCAAICPQGAISLIKGVARVNPERCIACGQCLGACPQRIIALIPFNAPVKVACSNKEKGAVARKKCSGACIGCSLCARNCPAEAIQVEGNLARVNYERCEGCGACQGACPQKCIL